MAFSLSASAQKSDNYDDSFNFKCGVELLFNQDTPDVAGALEYFKKEIAEHPANAKAYCFMGMIYTNTGKLEESLPVYTKAIKLTADDNGMKSLFYNQRGYSYWALGNDEKAFADWNVALKLGGEDAQCHCFRGQAYMKNKMYGLAADELVAALVEDNDNPAFDLMQQWRYPEVELLQNRLKTQFKKDPTDVKWLYYLAVVNEQNHNYNDAIEEYELVNKAQGNDIVSDRLSVCYDAIADWNNALDCINKAIARDSTNVSYVMQKADVLYCMGRTNDAIAECGRYIQLDQGYYGYYRRGFFKDNARDTDGAIKDYTSAIALNPDYAYSYQGRGDMYMRKGDKSAAEADYRKVVELDTAATGGNCAQFALLALGEKSRAVAFMDSILANSGDASNYYDATCLYARIGDRTKSLNYLKEALMRGYNRLAQIENDDDLDCLREMPEYKAVIEEYKREYSYE